MQFGIKRLPRDAQQFGCPADIAMTVIHHTLDVVALQFVQRLYLLSQMGAPDKPCGVGRADANPKLLLNDT